VLPGVAAERAAVLVVATRSRARRASGLDSCSMLGESLRSEARRCGAERSIALARAEQGVALRCVARHGLGTGAMGAILSPFVFSAAA